MPTPVIIDGFDHRVKDATFWGAASSGLWGLASNAAQITFDTATKRTGAASLKVAEDGVTATSLAKAIPAGNRVIVVSIYFRVASAPSVSSRMVVFVGPTNQPQFRIHTDGTIRASADGSATAVTGPNVADGNWHRLDARVDVSTATFRIDWSVDGTAQGQASASGQTAADLTYLRLGSGVATDTLTVWFDDLVASYTSADYPLGAHAVRFLVPNAEGTHNNAANIMERASDGADINGTTVTAWDLLDEWPPTTGINSADTVTQAANGTANYVEVQFGDITDPTVWGVEALAALQSDGTAANNGQTRIRNSAGTETTVYSGDMSDTAPRYQRAIVTVPTGGWTQAEVNALRARIGYSSDAAPHPEWLALALQVAVAEISGPVDTVIAALVVDSATDVPTPAVTATTDVTVVAQVVDSATDVPLATVATTTGVTVASPSADGALDAVPAVVTGAAVAQAVVADAATDSPAPSASISESVDAPAADLAADAPAATVSTMRSVTVSAPAADGPSDAPAAAVSGSAVVICGVSDAAADQPAPAVSTTSGATVPLAPSDAVADAPTVTVSVQVSVTAAPPPADSSADAPAATVVADGSLVVVAPVADATADGPTPSLIVGTVVLTTVSDGGCDVLLATVSAASGAEVPGSARASVAALARAAPTVSTLAVAEVVDRTLHAARTSDERAL